MQDQEQQEVSAQPDGGAPAAGTPGQDAQAAEGFDGQAGNSPDLEAQLSATEAKLAEMHEAYMRARADGENIRRRAQEDISKAQKFAIEGFAEALLPVRDSLEMALKVESPNVESLREGVEMTLKQLITAFEKNRLLVIEPAVGDKLDPMKHQAVAVVPADQEANTVVNVLQKGYMIADRLLRPAIVTAAQAK